MKNLIKQIDWSKNNGLVPAIVQDASTNSILMLGYMNKQALAKTLQTKQVWFYSRSRKCLWQKGETSGNFLNLESIKADCDRDVLLVRAQPVGPTCHTGAYSCFGEKPMKNILTELFRAISERKKNMPKGSYTVSLLKAGTEKISLKVAEEALEVIQAANKQTKRRLAEETVDLLYHLFVLLVDKKVDLTEIEAEIKKRKK